MLWVQFSNGGGGQGGGVEWSRLVNGSYIVEG